MMNERDMSPRFLRAVHWHNQNILPFKPRCLKTSPLVQWRITHRTPAIHVPVKTVSKAGNP